MTAEEIKLPEALGRSRGFVIYNTFDYCEVLD